jgi:hypothetical protein
VTALRNFFLIILTFFAARLGLRCFKPRLRPGVMAMSPEVIKDRFRGMYCQRPRFHLGPCEANRKDGEQEQWTG